MNKSYLFILLFVFCCSCRNDNKVEPSDNIGFLLDEPCMIVNVECDNMKEGEYLRVVSGGGTGGININPLNNKYYINLKGWEKWMAGWGTGGALYDAGVENLREIKSYNPESGKLELGRLLRGSGYPENGCRIVLWNREPSGFTKYKKGPVLDPAMFKNFAGNSFMYSTIVFDSAYNHWVMFVNEVDTSKISMYAAISEDLVNWKPALDGEPLFEAEDFLNTSWAGWNSDGKMPQSALITDVVRYNNKWHFIMNGFNRQGERQIAVVTTDDLLSGRFEIPHEASIKCGKGNDWDAKGVFYGKVVRYGNKFIMFFDGIKNDKTERLGMAVSEDMLRWAKYEKNPVIDAHDGWRGRPYCSEPAWAGICGKYICVLIAGSKDFKMGPWHHYISKRMYKDISGNVDDMQLGLFWSKDGGKTFYPYLNNPVFVNNYSDNDENEHLGGSISFIEKKDTIYLFYIGKTTAGGLHYQPLMRYRKIHEN